MNHKENIDTLPTEQIHDGTAFVKRLVRVEEKNGRLQTFNYAWIKKGGQLESHAHPDGIEYYYFLSGSGKMLLDKDWLDVNSGDFVIVPPKTTHSLKNPHNEDLKFLTIRTLLT